jgi:hypothetical protein
MDVKRFLLIPLSVRSLLLYSLAYVFVAIAVLFFPLYLWVRLRYRDTELQARMMIDAVAAEIPPPPPPVEAPPSVGVSQPMQPTAPPVPTAPPPSSAETGQAPEKAMSPEIEIDRILMGFLKNKRTLFEPKTIALPFLEARTYALHSKGAEGSYVLYHMVEDSHLISCFSAPEGDPPGNIELIEGITTMLQNAHKSSTAVSTLLRASNDYSRKNTAGFDVSLVIIHVNKKTVEYGSCGAGRALYLKEGEDVVKEISLENPALGSLSKDKFSKELNTADIKLSKGDLFCLVPPNGAGFTLDGESLDGILKENLLKRRTAPLDEVFEEITRRFDTTEITEKNLLPETGFFLARFL